MSWDLEGKARQCRGKDLREEIREILFEGEDTEIGRIVTIERIREVVGYGEWLHERR